MERVISLWFPSFATDRMSRRRGRGRRAEAFVTVDGCRGARLILTVSAAARAGGVAPGMTLGDARALIPELGAYPAAHGADVRALDRLAEWCERYTPRVAMDVGAGGDHGLFLDVGGSAHLFGGEAALIRDLVERLRGLGFHSRGGLAECPGAAWAMARFHAAAANEGAIVAPGGIAEALAELPIHALRLPRPTARALERLGLRHIGDLYRLPRAELARRFGEQVPRRLDQALGRAPEPISPRRPLPRWHERLELPEPIARADDIAWASRRLLERLCARLEGAHRGLRRLELTLYLSAGEVRRSRVGTCRPTRDPDHLFRLLAEHLDKRNLGLREAEGGGIEVMVLAAPATDPLPAPQLSLMSDEGARGAPGDTDLGPLVDRLGNRLGTANVVRLVPRASHIPERAALSEPPLGTGNAASWPDGKTRPLRLLSRPEAVETVAQLPDGPPLLFRWRRVLHRVARAEGPERIAPEWWRAGTPQNAATRDYYRVEDARGRRFWLYREGLYAPQERNGCKGGFETRPHAPGTQPRWYLHGIFA